MSNEDNKARHPVASSRSIGPVLDIQFEQGPPPATINAVRIHQRDGFDIPEPLDVTVEVQQRTPRRRGA